MRSYLAKNLVYTPLQMLRGENVTKYIKEYKESQWLRVDTILHYQWERIKSQINHSYYHVSYYRSMMKEYGIEPDDIKTFQDFENLPLLTKNDLQKQYNNLISDRFFLRARKKTTGGSTGEPVTLLMSPHALARARAAMYRGYSWFGVDIGDKQARFWGVPLRKRERITYMLIDLLMNRRRLSAFRFTESDLERYFNELQRYKPIYLYGYVSMLVQFAQYIQSRSHVGEMKQWPRHIVTTSEVLHDWERDILTETFGCTVQNEYGCGEVGPIAYECPHGNMHINTENVYVEFVKNKYNDELYNIVITELHNNIMPLIRYKIDDLSRGFSDECICGRGLTVIRDVIGREYDFIQLSNGTKYHGERLMYMFERLKNEGLPIRQFQVIQESLLCFIVKLVVDDEDSHESVKNRVKNIFNELSMEAEVKVQFVDTILREKSGKIKVIENKLKNYKEGTT